MSKQPSVAGVEPVQVRSWIAAPDAMAPASAMAAPVSSTTRGATPVIRNPNRHPAVGAAHPAEDPIEPWRRLQERLAPLLDGPQQQGDFPTAVQALALDILHRIDADPDLAILALLRLDSFDYAVAHALQTAIACDVHGHAMGTPPAQRLTLIQAALTMNIAMLELQRELEWQSTPPTPEQRRAIYLHPQRGRERLEALGVRDETWLNAVAQHHEAPDGSGYPSGCLGTAPEANVLAVADRYCAMLSRRGGRDSMAGPRAAHTLLNEARGERQALVARFIGSFGQHPPGSLVRLVNGEIGMVMRRGSASQAEQVCALAAASGEPLPQPLLRDTTEPVHVIVGSASDRDCKGMIDYVALQRLIG